MGIVTQRLGLLVKLVKNGSPLVFLDVINDVKGGCLGAIFVQRALAYFGRKIRALFEERHIEQRSSYLLMV